MTNKDGLRIVMGASLIILLVFAGVALYIDHLSAPTLSESTLVISGNYKGYTEGAINLGNSTYFLGSISTMRFIDDSLKEQDRFYLSSEDTYYLYKSDKSNYYFLTDKPKEELLTDK